MKIFILLIITTFLSVLNFAQVNEHSKPHYDIFSFEKIVNLPGTPEDIFDAATGDISGWWDHSFSGNPKKFYLEAKPGGGFYEIFDDKEVELCTQPLFIPNVQK